MCCIAFPTFISVFHCLLLLSLCSIASLRMAVCCTVSLFDCVSATSALVFLCLSYFYLWVTLFDTPVDVFHCLSTYISVFHCLRYSYPCVSLPLYLYIRPILPPLLLSLCFSASLLIYPSYTASGTPIPVCLRLSTYISVLYCLWYSYPCVPSPLYLHLCVPLRLLFLSLSSTASLLNVSVFYCLFSSCSCVPLPLLLLSRVTLSLLLVCTCFIASAIRVFVFYHVYFSYVYIPSPLLLVFVKVSVFRTRVPVYLRFLLLV
jgi:hypothetical protein